ncbi:MAG: chemotaxis protein CheD [Limnobacter sp.]|nr:chemotaxis protein CheD [Limnobacter sp.]
MSSVQQHTEKAAMRIKQLVMPGECYASWQPAEISTLLGSCVAACLYDKRLNIGGMNHFMLPDSPEPVRAELAASAQPAMPHSLTSSAPFCYGLAAMQKLIEDLMQMGAKREHLVAKVFGGANMTDCNTLAHIGKRNCEFVMRFLQQEGIRLCAADLGGVTSRRVRFYTDTGAVRVYNLPVANLRVLEQEKQYHLKMRKGPDGHVTQYS